MKAMAKSLLVHGFMDSSMFYTIFPGDHNQVWAFLANKTIRKFSFIVS